MPRDIAKILKNQRKRKILGQSDANTNLLMTSLLQDMFQEEMSEYLNKEKSKLEKELKILESGLEALRSQINRVGQIKQPKDGYTPVKGKDYFDGKSADEEKIIKNILTKIEPPKDGKDADENSIFNRLLAKIPKPKDGIDGKDGSPDTPEQVADKLNTLEEKVDMKVIKGLKGYFNNISKRIQEVKSQKGGGGGGMGNVVHQTLNVGSTTTSSSLSFKAAANGNAIWVYYQGQFLVKDTHYTISGSTITWLETFNDNTFVDITYIRA